MIQNVEIREDEKQVLESIEQTASNEPENYVISPKKRENVAKESDVKKFFFDFNK